MLPQVIEKIEKCKAFMLETDGKSHDLGLGGASRGNGLFLAKPVNGPESFGPDHCEKSSCGGWSIDVAVVRVGEMSHGKVLKRVADEPMQEVFGSRVHVLHKAK